MVLRFGTAGIPTTVSAKKGTAADGVAELKRFGLEAMEMEFVHSTWLKADKAPEFGSLAKKNGVTLTAHGSYYVNLFAKEPEKRAASRARVLEAAIRTAQAGGYSATFHPAFYFGESSEKVSAAVLEQLKKVEKELKDRGLKVWVRPETTGKPTQFGTYQELLALSQELEMTMPCIDFAHLHARTNGKYNTTDEWRTVLTDVENALGKRGLQEMHIHVSGIAYGEKGEKHHLMLDESDLNYKELLKVWNEFKIGGVVICESPVMEQDALLLQKTWKRL
jgi:deoxyribonuclease-4